MRPRRLASPLRIAGHDGLVYRPVLGKLSFRIAAMLEQVLAVQLNVRTQDGFQAAHDLQQHGIAEGAINGEVEIGVRFRDCLDIVLLVSSLHGLHGLRYGVPIEG